VSLLRDSRRIVGGIFVGGRSSRMGEPKGLMRAPASEGHAASTLVERAAAVLRGVGAEVVLVGERAEYAHLGLPALADAVPGVGPLGGLVALLDFADDGIVIACACDMPYVNEVLARRLLDAPPAAVVAPFAGGVLQPLFARYDARLCRPVARRRAEDAARGGSTALQGVLRELGAVSLQISPDEERWLVDWDTPHDISYD
jgi:molybdopterin-guanine dinucleotide biosynthesis protein A